MIADEFARETLPAGSYHFNCRFSYHSSKQLMANKFLHLFRRSLVIKLQMFLSTSESPVMCRHQGRDETGRTALGQCCQDVLL